MSTCGWRSASRTAPTSATCSPPLAGNAVVVPLLLADAYHARVDIPAMIARIGFRRTASRCARRGRQARCRCCVNAWRTPECRNSTPTSACSSPQWAPRRPQANARTASVANYLAQKTRWTATIAFATGPHPTLAEAAEVLRDRGATRLVIAPWFLAHGRITDRVANSRAHNGIAMAEPLGPHRLVAETVLDRFDEAVTAADRGLSRSSGLRQRLALVGRRRLRASRCRPAVPGPEWRGRRRCRLL